MYVLKLTWNFKPACIKVFMDSIYMYLLFRGFKPLDFNTETFS